MTQPEPLSGPDQLMHLELLLAHLRHCQETGTEFDTAAFQDHPLMHHMRATARQRAWAILRRPIPPNLTDEIAFQQIIRDFEETP